MLLTWHNLAHYQRLTSELRLAISQSRLADWARAYSATIQPADAI